MVDPGGSGATPRAVVLGEQNHEALRETQAETGREEKIAIVAAARKLLQASYRMLRDREPFRIEGRVALRTLGVIMWQAETATFWCERSATQG